MELLRAKRGTRVVGCRTLVYTFTTNLFCAVFFYTKHFIFDTRFSTMSVKFFRSTLTGHKQIENKIIMKLLLKILRIFAQGKKQS